MPKHEVSARRLVQCCTHLSEEIFPAAPHDAFERAVALVRHVARESPREVAWALVYRVVETDSASPDRLGAWLVLDHAMRASSGMAREAADAGRTAEAARFAELLDCIAGGQLAPLVAARWDEYKLARPSSPSAPPPSDAAGAPSASDMAAQYRALRHGWVNTLFDSATASRLSGALAAVQRHGYAPAGDLQPAEAFVDALWKLRRSEPRPSSAVYVATAYLSSAGMTEDSQRTAIRQVASGDLSAAPHMPPKAVEWVKRLHQQRPSLRCDMWSIAEHRCPCAPGHIAALRVPASEEARAALRRFQLETVLTSPFAPDVALGVADALVGAMRQEVPWEPLLAAFDSRRGSTTDAVARAALHIIASFSGLLPSQLLGRSGPVTLEKLRTFLVVRRRRINEFRMLSDAVSALDTAFLGRLGPDVAEALATLKERGEMIFAPLGLATWTPPRWAAAAAKRAHEAVLRSDPQFSDQGAVPQGFADGTVTDVAILSRYRKSEALLKVAGVAAQLCRRCLAAQHSADRCPEAEAAAAAAAGAGAAAAAEHWDHLCARRLLERHGLEGLEPGLDAERRINDARHDVLAGRRSDPAALGRLAELDLALAVVMDNRVPYCRGCRRYGHEARTCQPALERELREMGVAPVEAALDPQAVRRRADGNMRTDDRELKSRGQRLLDAVTFFERRFRPDPRHRDAFCALRGDRRRPITLAAARYATEDACAYARAAGQHALLPHIAAAAEPGFPAVPCLFTSRTDRTTDAWSAPVAAFIGALRKHHGVTLEELLSRSTADGRRAWAALTETQLPALGESAEALTGWRDVQDQQKRLVQQLRAPPPDAAVLRVDASALAVPTQQLSQQLMAMGGRSGVVEPAADGHPVASSFGEGAALPAPATGAAGTAAAAGSGTSEEAAFAADLAEAGSSRPAAAVAAGKRPRDETTGLNGAILRAPPPRSGADAAASVDPLVALVGAIRAAAPSLPDSTVSAMLRGEVQPTDAAAVVPAAVAAAVESLRAFAGADEATLRAALACFKGGERTDGGAGPAATAAAPSGQQQQPPGSEGTAAPLEVPGDATLVA